MEFSSFVDKIFLSLLIALGGYAARELSTLSNSIHNLGEAVVTLGAKEIATQDKLKDVAGRISDMDNRIRSVEIRMHAK